MTLDTGRCPPWLFERMRQFCGLFFELVTAEFGPTEVVRRLSDPVWFQSVGCVAGFDWNASGLTTTLTAAIKEGIAGKESQLGWCLCGGKGRTALKTPAELQQKTALLGIPLTLQEKTIRLSRLTAKIDNSLVQDGFTIYHHVFIVSRSGEWAVIQQGMNTQVRRARRYQWFNVPEEKLLHDPHLFVSGVSPVPRVLNMSATASHQNRQATLHLIQHPGEFLREIKRIEKHWSHLHAVERLQLQNGTQLTLLELNATEFRGDTRCVVLQWFHNTYLKKLLAKLSAHPPENYLQLIETKGVGAASIRALALVAELAYGASPSYKDPARYTYAHGGKDGTPYPVRRQVYDRTLDLLRKVVARIRFEQSLRTRATRALHQAEMLLSQGV